MEESDSDAFRYFCLGQLFLIIFVCFSSRTHDSSSWNFLSFRLEFSGFVFGENRFDINIFLVVMGYLVKFVKDDHWFDTQKVEKPTLTKIMCGFTMIKTMVKQWYCHEMLGRFYCDKLVVLPW